jgi:hypothetical protein
MGTDASFDFYFIQKMLVIPAKAGIQLSKRARRIKAGFPPARE